MPDYPRPNGQWLPRQLTGIKTAVAALAAGQTTYITNPATGACMVIIGNVSADSAGNATGIGTAAAPVWGIASFKTGAWVQVA